MANESESSTWIFDYGVIEGIEVPGDDLPSLEPSENQLLWPSHSFTHAAPISLDLDDSFQDLDDIKKEGSRKRVRPELRDAPISKACRQKLQRDRLNDRFVELASILNPGRSSKAEKSVILVDAIRTVTQLQDEAQKLKESNQNLQEKINELKAGKNELRNEKQKLKSEKEHLERQILASTTPSGFLPHPPAIPAPFPAIGQVVSNKLVPLLATLGFRCGNTCHLLLLITQKVTFYSHPL